jgi:hypothetical protein
MRARPFAAYAADLQQNATGSGSATGGPSRYTHCSVYFAAPEQRNHLNLLFYCAFLIDDRRRNSEITAANSKINSGGTAGHQRHR